uniref:Uncharacterized protein n=1 Tax=Oryza glumipatula TaxID=40148 RepID=A0A0E0A7G3_9ORYZ
MIFKLDDDDDKSRPNFSRSGNLRGHGAANHATVSLTSRSRLFANRGPPPPPPPLSRSPPSRTQLRAPAARDAAGVIPTLLAGGGSRCPEPFEETPASSIIVCADE